MTRAHLAQTPARLLIACAALLASARSSRAFVTVKHDAYVELRDDGTLAQTRWSDPSAVELSMRRITGAYLAEMAKSGADGGAAAVDETQLVVVLTTFSGAPSWFYLAMKNDIAGIGWKNEPEAQLPTALPGDVIGDDFFDLMVGTKVEGIVFLGDLPYWSQAPSQLFARVAMQEIGHRYCCYLRFNTGSGRNSSLLGRAANHWSFWLESGNSPMEGNRFRDAGGGRYQTDTSSAPLLYDPLTLYTMGLTRLSDVGPLKLLTPSGDISALRDSNGAHLSASSPPYLLSPPLEFAATAQVIPTSAIIQAEGARAPAPGRFPLRVGVVLVVGASDGGVSWEAQASQLAERLVSDFSATTGGRGTLVLATKPVVATPPRGGGGCDSRAGCDSRGEIHLVAPLLLLALAASFRSIRSRHPRRRPFRF